MNAMLKIATLTNLVAEIGDCDEIQYSLDGFIKVLSDLKTAKNSRPVVVPVFEMNDTQFALRFAGSLTTPINDSDDPEDNIPIRELMIERKIKLNEQDNEKKESELMGAEDINREVTFKCETPNPPEIVIIKNKRVVKKKVEKKPETTIHGLTYIISTRIGECGADRSLKKLYFPFYLMGACGEDEAVISWNGVRERIVAPKKMNCKWFELLSHKLKSNGMFDYDWVSFSRNILAPNREHIKSELGINDDKVDRLLSDGYVFLNHFNDSFADEGGCEGHVEGEDIGYYPTFANFLKYDNLEY